MRQRPKISLTGFFILVALASWLGVVPMLLESHFPGTLPSGSGIILQLPMFFAPALVAILITWWNNRTADAGLADREVVGLRQMRGCDQIALAQQRQRLCGSHIRHPKHELMPAHERFSRIQSRDRAGQIALGKLQTSQEYSIRNDGVDAFHLSRQLEALVPVLLSGLQVIPLIGYTGQAKMRLAGNRPRRITCQHEHAPVGLGRQQQLVACFLEVAQTECGRCRVDRSSNDVLIAMTSA